MVRYPPWIGLWLAVLAGIGLVAGPARSLAQEGDREYLIKAAFLPHFFRFVEWPKNALPGNDKTFVLGILGPDPFGNHLKRVEGQIIHNKKIVVLHFPAIQDYKPCHLLFIAPSAGKNETASQRLAKALTATKGAPVLLVGDTEGLAQKGAGINMVIRENYPKLQINLDAAKRAGLTIDVRLLKLAEIVRDAP